MSFAPALASLAAAAVSPVSSHALSDRLCNAAGCVWAGTRTTDAPAQPQLDYATPAEVAASRPTIIATDGPAGGAFTIPMVYSHAGYKNLQDPAALDGATADSGGTSALVLGPFGEAALNTPPKTNTDEHVERGV